MRELREKIKRQGDKAKAKASYLIPPSLIAILCTNK